jgi:hypothetical protein
LVPAHAAIIEPVYGDADNRQDLWEVSDPRLLELARSTAILVEAGDLEAIQTGGFKAISGRSLQRRMGVCESERFSEQLTLSSQACSGALVGPDLLLTAGHCVPDAQSCADLRIVFGYGIMDELDEDGDPEPVFGARDVYSCRALVSPAFGPGRTRPDFAVIRLDRVVVGRQPLKIARSKAEVKTGTKLVIIGHPSGLPTKVAADATVNLTLSMDLGTDYFYSDLDSYHGNSGSPVFNARTGLIEGVLIDGADDFEQAGRGSCRVSRKCQYGINCQGEKSTRISLAAPYITGSRR